MNIEHEFLNFADEMKFGEVINGENNRRPQDDIVYLVKWAERWQIKFNLDTCQVMSFGRPDKYRAYIHHEW